MKNKKSVYAVVMIFITIIILGTRNGYPDVPSNRWEHLVCNLFNDKKYQLFRMNSNIIINRNGTIHSESRSLGASMTSDGFVQCNGIWKIIDDTLIIEQSCSNKYSEHNEYKDYRYWEDNSMLYLSPIRWPELENMTSSEFMALKSRPAGGIIWIKQ